MHYVAGNSDPSPSLVGLRGRCKLYLSHLGQEDGDRHGPHSPHPCILVRSTGASLPEILRVTKPVKIRISGNHQEEMVFLVMRSPRFPLVLGKPWLRKHNPQVDWVRGLITGWNPECHSNCLLSATIPATTSNPTTYPPPDLSSVPKEYHDLEGGIQQEQGHLPTSPPIIRLLH